MNHHKLINRQIRLKSRPVGEARVDDFELVEVPVPELHDGQVLVRIHYLSVDPYMRGRMSDAKSYAAPQPLGEVMLGGTVGQVIASRNPQFQVDDFVSGLGGWQEYQVVDGASRNALRRIDTRVTPLTAYLGAVGMTGVTAWYGLTKICEPKAGETVVVSAASGAVGTVVGQLAKQRGCRAVGIAGGAEKCSYVVDELGFDACVDYKAHADAASLLAAIHAAAPDGIDCCFENVGGPVFDAELACMNAHGRIALCGMVSRYDGSSYQLANAAVMLSMRLKLQGFIVGEHMDVWPRALAELGGLVAAGKLKYRETISEGVESAPEALLGLLKGRNFGKQLVKLI
ncbi:NADP-dependent oxidoreductase [soil metagenome]